MSDNGDRDAPAKTTPENGSNVKPQSGDTQESSRQYPRRPQVTVNAPAAATTLPPQPHELTAEWTVRAQLTFARAGEKVQREFSSNDPVNPVRVVYKWSTFDSPLPPDDADADVDLMDDSSSSTLHKRNSFTSRGSRQSTPLKTAPHSRRWQQQPHESFRSTTSSTNADLGGGDSAFSGSNTSKQRQRPYQRQTPTASASGPNTTGAIYGTRCRSTCNIVVSAVADFLPTNHATSDGATSTQTTANEDFMMSSGGSGLGGATTHVKASATDFIAEEEADPFVFNTRASYTVLPQASIDSTISTGSKNFTAFGKVLALRDAFSQTSDTETKYFEEREREYERRRYANSRSPIDRRIGQHHQHQQKERKSYEQRRATTEGLLLTPSGHSGGGDSYVDEANSFMPSFLTSPSHTFKSASMPRIPSVPEQMRSQQEQQQQTLASKQKSNSSEPLKKPRTVHIDVYCTGSEDEEEEEEGAEGGDEGDHADAEASASSNDDDENASKRYDLESNSTPQTVFDNEQLLLKHKRITGQTMPRRLQPPTTRAESQATKVTKTENTGDLNIGHAITKSSTAEEVSESKQLLFRKHIGDQRAAKLSALRQKYMRQPSDDAISSNYPNSSRSTVRDATCSSIASSVVASSQAEYADSSWKETEDLEEIYSLAKSDSFEYENTTDRLRIKQMERFWSRTSSMDEPSGQGYTSSGSPVRGHIQGAFLQPISEVSSQRNSPFTTPFKRYDTMPSESEVFSETSDIYYTYPGATATTTTLHTSPTYLQQTSHFPRNRPGFLQFFGPSTSPNQQQQQHTYVSSQSPITVPEVTSPPHAQLLYSGYQPYLQRWKSETRDNLSTHDASSPAEHSSYAGSPPLTTRQISPAFQRSGSEAPPTTSSAATFHQSPMIGRRFEMKHESSAISEASTTHSGYTPEHLLKAKKFGTVVSSARKPGHHVGPTKNPSCACESCQRWLAERFQVRGRAFSLGERPVLRRPT
ncbi:uncharacterized protein Hgs_2 [Zeugodacus cucurbitae]|uniref:uncharacterized protein Hgs_2 n=1 Tax=Zeugodacus cucurbitae TaxID=28588 RepID=UPI0023D92D27|nr:uncharacterized protein Hgs_2 [Zeugodacus cucurbitae]XP_011196402.2 uncharacterized protein Hgs_2 [Zeugodacus cucurbitae]XP_028902235.2 uncharacterized protein Hgs_2 [Zeugodacus cucurbitae]XP_054090971.1 uncharacterized protein Hgs_2 [Zeugodacus cucurbitae]XP_054090972.1 uncharacterized protein Hgs_2 [Zeugodacus cucurbitae]XP_054090973.1 uncharacterized protein Hgs_2 [Zeugodacus cucurbitae]XP_054090974.1 uncharacterized protein Hgs_2 [Zeugodacus cucurbitae]